MRERLAKQWWIWLAILVLAVIGNELFDRKVAADKNGHPGGDLLVALVLVAIVYSGSAFVGRRRARRH
jgi:hypothetical protein